VSALAFDRRRLLLIGVVHLEATPGAPRAAREQRLERLLERAADDARALAAGGADALLVENFGDAPFHAGRVPPETVAALALALAAVGAVAPDLPLGVNVLRNDARSALGLCAATRASFVRINVHTGVAVADQGLLHGKEAETLRDRARLAPGVLLLCDVEVKHARPLAGRTLEEEAADTLERGLADALIVTGAATGQAPDAERVRRVVRAAGGRPVLVGSGLTPGNAAELLGAGAAGAPGAPGAPGAIGAMGAIVGSALMRDGRAGSPVELARVRALRAALDVIRR
jgi:membrane complex biogenesis BtpA family protein